MWLEKFNQLCFTFSADQKTTFNSEFHCYTFDDEDLAIKWINWRREY